VANGQTILTNSELAAVDYSMREAGAKASAAAVIGSGTGYALSYGVQALVGAACADGDCANEARTSYQIGSEGAQRVWNHLNDPTLQTEVKVYVNEAGRRANYFTRLDGLTNTAIHEVKTVSNLSLSQNFMDQAHRYKLLADSMGIELHYWLTNSSPQKVVNWLQQQGIIVHTGTPGQ
jgi:hypothetical protein